MRAGGIPVAHHLDQAQGQTQPKGFGLRPAGRSGPDGRLEAGMTVDSSMQRVGEELALVHPAISREFALPTCKPAWIMPRQEARDLGVRTANASMTFGQSTIYAPWTSCVGCPGKEVIVDADNIESYAGDPPPGFVLLKDQILDKRVLDIEDRELEVVYDVKLTLKNGKLYVIEVDLSKYSLLRRMGLRWLAELIYRAIRQSKA